MHQDYEYFMHYNFLICVKDKPSADQATSTSNKRKSSSDKHKSSSKKQRNSEVRPISASKKTEEKKKDLAKRCVLFMLKIFYIRTTQILMIFVNVFSSFLLGDAFCDFLMMFSYKDVDIAQISNHKC